MATTAKSRGFFALDVQQFEKIKRNGLGVEEAATYLCLLTGTDQTNITSSWGINSVVGNTGLSRSEAKRAVKNLAKHGIIECLEVKRARARAANRYNLPIYDDRWELSKKEKSVYDAIVVGQQPLNASEIQAAHRAKKKGWLESLSANWSVIEHFNDVAFIPNSFVRVSQGHSPLYRLVNNGEIGPIMLAAELYQIQNLMDDRGVNPEIIRGHFRSSVDCQFGRYKLHELEAGRIYIDPEDGQTKSFDRVFQYSWRTPDFWNNLRVLDSTHVIEWSVYSANGKPDETDKYSFHRPQRPLGVLRNGKQVLNTPESLPAFMAYLIHHIQAEGGNLDKPLSELILNWQKYSPIIAVENTSVSHVEGRLTWGLL